MSLRIGFVAVIRPIFKGDSPTVAQGSLEGLERLGAQEGFEVVTPRLSETPVHGSSGLPLPHFAVHDEGSARAAAAQLADEELDLLLVQLTTFSTGESVAPLLRLPVPLGLWAVPEAAGSQAMTGPLPLNSLCGLNMTLSFLERPPVSRQAPAKWFYGAPDTAWFRERLSPTLTALRGLRTLRQARILQVGGTAPHFYGLEEEPRLPGVRVDRMPLSELFERIAHVPREEAKAIAGRWRRTEQADVTDEQLMRSAALELALGQLLSDGGYEAVALRCWPELPDETGTMACATLARLGDGSVAAACEGDVMGALSMLALQAMSGEGALLMDLSDIEPQRGAFFWHCGNGPLSWAAAPTRLSTHFNREGVGTVRDMVVRAGPATGFRLLDGGDRALVFAGDFAETSGEAGGFDGVRGWLGNLRWAGGSLSPKGFLSNILDYRLPHHFAFGSGDLTDAMIELCGWLGAEVLPRKAERNVMVTRKGV